MVIPLGGGGGGGAGGMMGEPMIGPPPRELEPRFRIIKVCLILQIIGLIVQLGSGIPLQPSNTYNIVFNSLDVVLIIVVGIFLLKDDPTFGGAHACLVRTCCSSCQDQCQGGVSCLCSWFIICILTAVMALLPVDGSQMLSFIAGFKVLLNNGSADGTKWGYDTDSIVWEILFLVYFTSEVVVILSQLIGGWQGFKGFQEMTALQGAGGSGGAMPQDGGYGGDSGGVNGARGAAPSSGGNGGGGDPSSGQARQPTFQPFAGNGNRLGS